MRWAAALALLAAFWAGAGAAADITEARYGAPTTRYAHGVLGDKVEWGALILTLSNRQSQTITLPDTSVFEDIAPRLADVDGDGDAEVIVIEASLSLGARLAIYDKGGLVAATPHIGRPHRWLAPIGTADLDGDGRVELAYVDRPHLAKRLRIWRYAEGELKHVADAEGFTNHRIGWDFIAGGLRQCGNLPEMITASGDWSRILTSRLVSGRIETRDLGVYSGPDSLTAALNCP